MAVTPVVATFNVADGTTLDNYLCESGHGWQKHASYSGVMSINGKMLEKDNTANNAVYYTSNDSVSHGMIEAIYRVNGGALTVLHSFGVCWQIDPAADTFYYADCVSVGTGSAAAWNFTLNVGKRVAGVQTDFKSLAFTIPTDGTLRLRVYVDGTGSLIAQINDVTFFFEVVDTSITAAGKWGVKCNGSTNNGKTWCEQFRFMPGPTLLDTFADVDGTALENHTPNIGGVWTVVSGGNAASIKIDGTNSRAYQVASGTNGVYYNTQRFISPDCTVFMYLTKLTATGTSSQWQVGGRADPDDLQTMIYMNWFGDNAVEQMNFFNNNVGTTQIGSNFTETLSNGTTYLYTMYLNELYIRGDYLNSGLTTPTNMQSSYNPTGADGIVGKGIIKVAALGSMTKTTGRALKKLAAWDIDQPYQAPSTRAYLIVQ